MQSDCVV